MRLWAALALLLVGAATARGEERGVDVAVGGVRACFGREALVAALRKALPQVRAGSPPGDGVAVSIEERGATLTVEVVLREGGQVVARETRGVSTEVVCDEQLALAALIVERAAQPLGHVAAAPVVKTPRPHPKPRPKPAIVEVEPRPEPQVEPRPQPQPEPQPPPQPQPQPPPQPQPQISRVVLPWPRTRLRRVDLDASAGWMIPLDGPPAVPQGTLEVSVRAWRRLGVGLHVGVAQDWAAQAMSGTTTLTLRARPVPLALVLQGDIRLPVGTLRLAVGPRLDVWLLATEGLARPVSRTIAQPGVVGRAAWRLEFDRVSVGVALDVAAFFVAEELAIGGVGVVGHTPFVSLTPMLELGFRL